MTVMTEAERKALGLLGLAARAGRITLGLPLTCEALRHASGDRSPHLVLLSADASANTAKRITDRTQYYHIPLCRLRADGAALATAIGKRGGDVAVVGITEPHLAEAVSKQLAAAKEEPQQN